MILNNSLRSSIWTSRRGGGSLVEWAYGEDRLAEDANSTHGGAGDRK